MGKVKTLREEVYKKIAAGEVVERPLSVVKELVENAIDAGADNIKIEVMDGGKRFIRVTDNGSGFAADDIETAFKNHSTSKISELTDFDSLDTLGFRGEALPSIMEVSKIELKTSDNNEGRGTLARLEGGKILETDDIAFNRGSSIEVKELFYNFPVRQKFLKTERTELNQIVSFIEPVTLVHFDKSFELVHNGRTMFSYKKVPQLKDRVYQVFGKEFLDNLQEVDFQLDDYKITGFVSRINTGVAVKKHQYFFVNRRPVREKTLFAAVSKTFERFLEKSKKPACILMLDIPPREVDVNIHPMKLEIKFVDSSSIFRFIKHAVEQTFGAAADTHYNAPAAGRANFGYNGDGGVPGVARAYESGGWHETGNRQPGSGGSAGGNVDARGYSPLPGQGSPGGGAAGMQTRGTSVSDFEQTQLFSSDFLSEDDFKLIGQYKNSYILIEKNGTLLIVDQHNAQERVNFDKLKEEYEQEGVASVNPLFPVIIELTVSEAESLDQAKLDLLNKMGFRLEPLSGNSYDIKTFPQILGERSIKDAVMSLIHLKEGDINFEDAVLAEIACKSAIKINHKLYPDQMKTIVKNLFKTTNPYFCPHKRPIIIEFTLEEIEKMMKRK